MRAGARALSADGHRVVGIDTSPTLLGLAREAGGYEELVCGDAAALPWQVATFDLAIAYMSLQDVDDLTSQVARHGSSQGPHSLLAAYPSSKLRTTSSLAAW